MTPTEPDPIVLVVDDDASFRTAIGRLLGAAGFEFELYASAEALLRRRPLDRTGCILLDLDMPGKNGLDLQADLAARGIGTPVVFLTGRGDIPSTVTAIKAGALDFLTKPVRKGPLVAAIEAAFERDRVRRAAEAARKGALLRVGSLTPREREVMHLVVRGLLNKQIAAELNTSEATVKVHRGRVMQKMRVVSVADLVRAVQEAGLESPEPSPPPPASAPPEPPANRPDAGSSQPGGHRH
jgi:FixJ family two-component response regulator